MTVVKISIYYITYTHIYTQAYVYICIYVHLDTDARARARGTSFLHVIEPILVISNMDLWRRLDYESILFIQ